MGIFFALIAFINLCIVLYKRMVGIIDVEGYSSLLILMLFGFGIVMFSLGILGEYMWRMFDATRNRPPFIIDEDKKRS